MTSKLIEIASELASQYPHASAKQIAGIIIDSIESEPVIKQAIALLITPDRTQIRLAEFRSKRRPKQRPKIQERIDNAYLFKRLQNLFIYPSNRSSVGPIFESDGGRLDIYSYPSYPGFSSEPFISPRPTVDSTQTIQPIPISPSYSIELPVYKQFDTTLQDTGLSISQLLEEISTKSQSGNLLSFYDIYHLIGIININLDNNSILSDIGKILDIDISLRHRTFRSNPVDDLYRDNNLLPEEYRVPHPRASNLLQSICIKIESIIQNEYKALHGQFGQLFIDRKITYEDYLQSTERYSLNADQLLSSLPKHTTP